MEDLYRPAPLILDESVVSKANNSDLPIDMASDRRHTRSRGPAEELPWVQPRTLEYSSRK